MIVFFAFNTYLFSFCLNFNFKQSDFNLGLKGLNKSSLFFYQILGYLGILQLFVIQITILEEWQTKNPHISAGHK